MENELFLTTEDEQITPSMSSQSRAEAPGGDTPEMFSRLPTTTQEPQPATYKTVSNASQLALLTVLQHALYDAEQRLKKTEKSDNEAIWNNLHNAMDKYDDGMLKRWKDFMNNLLIFAGLFSAVVTAFIIDSYKWLQPDPVNAASGALRRIASGLTELSAAVNYEHLNSTVVVSASASDDVPSSQPTGLQLAVNILWFLSLTMSLVAALFAILVQQWLQEYPVRGEVASGRAGVRIRHYRYRALHKWGVPDIVMLLPGLLQVALVLFFVGLVILLWTLNDAVAIAVSAFLAIPAVFIAASTVLPLMWISCPYKSPLSVVTYTMWQVGVVWTFGLAQSAFLGAGSFFFHCATGFESAMTALGKLLRQQWQWQMDLGNRFTESFIRPSTAIFFTNSQRYHLRLSSRRQFAARDIGISQKMETLDSKALVWAKQAMPSKLLVQLEPCLSDLGPEVRANCVLSWTETALGFKDWTVKGGSFAIDHLFAHQRIFSGMDEDVVVRLRQLLLFKSCKILDDVSTSPQEGSSSLVVKPRLLLAQHSAQEKTVLTSAIGPILLVLRQLVKQQPPLETSSASRYIDALIDFVVNLHPSVDAEGPRILARSIFEYWYHRESDPPLDAQRLDAMTDVVLKQDKITNPGKSVTKLETRLCIDALISFVAAILLGHKRISSLGSQSLNRVVNILEVLRRFTERDKGRIMLGNGMSFDSSKEDQDISVPVWPSLCQSLLDLSISHPELKAQPVMRPLVQDLLAIFEGKQSPRTKDVLQPLEALKVLYISPFVGVDILSGIHHIATDTENQTNGAGPHSPWYRRFLVTVRRGRADPE